MVTKNYNSKRIRINLSNTESVSTNIYKYNNLKKEKVSSTSATSTYFLTTNKKVGLDVNKILKCDTTNFVCDVAKTKKCILEQEKILKIINKKDFYGQLNAFYNSKNFFDKINNTYLDLDKCKYYEDSNKRHNIHFKNDLENVKKFRNSIVAIICDLIIEPKGTINIVYPVIKEPVPKPLLKEKFLSWLLQNTNLTSSSIGKYEHSLDETNLEALDEKIIEKSLYEVLSFEEINTMQKQIFNSQSFIAKKNIRNNINSAALNHYYQFIKEYYHDINNHQEPISTRFLYKVRDIISIV